MRFFQMFGNPELRAFANALAEDLTRRFPVASEKRTDAGATNQLKVILQGLGGRAVRFRDERKIGIYGCAKMANIFKWKLKECGYSDAFVDRVTRDLATYLGVRAKQ
jgi:hypothetical protein